MREARLVLQPDADDAHLTSANISANHTVATVVDMLSSNVSRLAAALPSMLAHDSVAAGNDPAANGTAANGTAANDTSAAGNATHSLGPSSGPKPWNQRDIWLMVTIGVTSVVLLYCVAEALLQTKMEKIEADAKISDVRDAGSRTDK